MNRIKFIFLLLISFSLFAQNNELDEKFSQKMAYKRKVYEQTLKFITQNPESPGIAGLYFNLAEMSTEIDAASLRKTANYYQKVLELDPEFIYQDAVLYNIGYFTFEAEKDSLQNLRYQNIDLVVNWPDSLRISAEKAKIAIESYQKIEAEFPYSEYHTEAIYRLGAIYFELALDARNPQELYPIALKYFDTVARKKGDDLQHFGLFQRGWTNFTSGKFIDAIDDFTEILEIINRDSLKTTEKMFFEADAIENMAFSLSEYDENFVEKSVAAQKAKEIFSNFVSDEYGKEIILAAIDLKLKYNAPMQAIDLYNAFIEIYPQNRDCPSFVDSVMTVYKRYPSMTRNNVDAIDLIIAEEKRLVEDFTIDSAWFKSNSGKDISKQLGIIRKSFKRMGDIYHNKFITTNAEKDFVKFENLVARFCEFDIFLNEEIVQTQKDFRKRVIDLNFHLAEFSQNPVHYFNVVGKYREFNELYPNHADIFDFQENIFICLDKSYDLLLPQIETQTFVDTLHNITLDKNGLDSLYINASLDYEDLLSDVKLNRIQKSERVRTIYKRAKIRFEGNDLDSAFVDYEKLLTFRIDKNFKKICNVKLAEISELNGDFGFAEKFYQEASKFASKSEKKDLQQNALASINSAAETLLNNGNAEVAAAEYLRLAKELENTNVEKSIGFMLRAIDVYKNINEYQKAIDLFLQIADLKQNKNEILAAFSGAWSISDSLAENADLLSAITLWKQSENLRNQFIKKYKKSNEAYILRRQIIEFYENYQFNDKEKAAKM
ncbi:MAG: hypothetical protein HN952_06505, partial [Candidatus Cloacimonetes bacterium]|nr:hypothetical protein [Candidatus Cloacimonadota bacterium]